MCKNKLVYRPETQIILIKMWMNYFGCEQYHTETNSWTYNRASVTWQLTFHQQKVKKNSVVLWHLKNMCSNSQKMYIKKERISEKFLFFFKFFSVTFVFIVHILLWHDNFYFVVLITAIWNMKYSSLAK